MSEGRRKRGGERERGLAPPLLISANGFCRARREQYALIMQRGKKWGDWACRLERLVMGDGRRGGGVN